MSNPFKENVPFNSTYHLVCSWGIEPPFATLHFLVCLRATSAREYTLLQNPQLAPARKWRETTCRAKLPLFIVSVHPRQRHARWVFSCPTTLWCRLRWWLIHTLSPRTSMLHVPCSSVHSQKKVYTSSLVSPSTFCGCAGSVEGTSLDGSCILVGSLGSHERTCKGREGWARGANAVSTISSQV